VTIVDASVAIKWLLPEPDTDHAEELLESGEHLAAPALIRTEVAAAIARKVRMQEIAPRDGGTAFDLWLRCISAGVIALVPDEAHIHLAWTIAVKLNHPLPDCLYLAAAERLEAALVTADRKFVTAARKTYPRARLLGVKPAAPDGMTSRSVG
jgi:predicted nucleic acid-binding protein